MTLVTVIIRTEGKRPQQLEKAIRSAAGQSHGMPEIIVVEDGGKAAETLAQTLGARHIAIPKSGRSAAGNAGLAAARGDVVCFLDDDDWFLPQHLAVLVPVLEKKPELGAAYAMAEMVAVEAGREVSRKLFGTLPFRRAQLWLHNLFPLQAVVFRRGLYQQYGGFDEKLEALEDWDLWLRYSFSHDFEGVADITSAFVVPASRKVLRERAKAHEPYRLQVLAKHANDKAQFSFAEIQDLHRNTLGNLATYVGMRVLCAQLLTSFRKIFS